MKRLTDYIIEKANFLIKKHVTHSLNNKENQDVILKFVCKELNIKDTDEPIEDNEVFTKWNIPQAIYIFPSNMITKLYNEYGKENYGVGKDKVRVQICRDDDSSYLIWYKDALPIQVRWINRKEKYVIRFNKKLDDENYDVNPK